MTVLWRAMVQLGDSNITLLFLLITRLHDANFDHVFRVWLSTADPMAVHHIAAHIFHLISYPLSDSSTHKLGPSCLSLCNVQCALEPQFQRRWRSQEFFTQTEGLLQPLAVEERKNVGVAMAQEAGRRRRVVNCKGQYVINGRDNSH